MADEGAETSYVIESTPAPSVYHPTTLYRMVLIGPEDVPEMVVFENQRQFSTDSRSSPAIGTAVDGGTRAVHINDIMAEHGVRSGPVDSSWRRVTIVVSRNELLSPDEMDYWNFFAARHEARSGATTLGGEVAGNRFDIPLRFDDAGRYGIAVLLKDQADDVNEPNVTRLSMISGITVQ